MYVLNDRTSTPFPEVNNTTKKRTFLGTFLPNVYENKLDDNCYIKPKCAQCSFDWSAKRYLYTSCDFKTSSVTIQLVEGFSTNRCCYRDQCGVER